MEIENIYKLLIESLKLLASTYEVQCKSLPDFAVVRDEVIGDFEDVFLLMPQLIENDYISKNAIASIIRCYNIMEMIAINEDKSDYESLIESFKNSKDWQKIRELAKEALINMNEKIEDPDM